MNDVTRILAAIDHGDARAAEQLLPLVYDELRRLATAKMASERPDHTLEARSGTPPGRPSEDVSMNDVTPILSAIESGDPRAAEQLLPLVYDALRRLAAQRHAD